MPATAGQRQRLTGLVAVGEKSGVNALGYIVWFSVPDEDISLRRVKHQWGLAGLELGVLPKDPKAVDAFKRAVRNQEGRRVVGDRTIETDVREVLENSEDVIYQVSRVVKDLNERVVEYPKALTVWYSKVTGELGFKRLRDDRDTGSDRLKTADVMEIFTTIQSDFELAGNQITGAKVRSLVRTYLKDDTDEQAGTVGLSGENLRGKAGGVYFVLAKFKDQLDALAEFLRVVYKPEGRAYMHIIPLADGASERELIRRHHVDNSVAEVNAAIAEAATLLREGRDREIRSNVVSHHWTKLHRLRRRAAAYAEVLQGEQDELSMKLAMMDRQLKKLPSVGS